MYWEDYRKSGLNPLTQVVVQTSRRRLTTAQELPLGETYENLIRSLLPPAA